MKVVCGHCGVTNRISSAPGLEDKRPICGKCKKPLEPEAPGYVIEADQITLTEHLSQDKVPVFLDIWGAHCPPCRQLAPELEKLAKELAGQVKVVKVNAEQNPMVAQGFKVRGVPTLILFRKNKEIARTMGFQPVSELKRFIQGELG